MIYNNESMTRIFIILADLKGILHVRRLNYLWVI